MGSQRHQGNREHKDDELEGDEGAVLRAFQGDREPTGDGDIGWKKVKQDGPWPGIGRGCGVEDGLGEEGTPSAEGQLQQLAGA